jgi:hypothetical protein
LSARQPTLAGVKVLDITSAFMGPLATQHLGDLGADVLKIESLEGDSTRYIGPGGDQGVGPLFRSGKLRALAVTSPSASSSFPGVPSMAEQGLSEYSMEAWIAVYLPA